MTNFFQHLFTKYPVKTQRFLELLPGTAAWLVILSPFWGSFFFPVVIAYFVLFFDVYWFYKSFSLVITAYIASKKIAVAENINWWEKVKNHSHVRKVNHVIVIPNYKERVEKLRVTLQAIAEQNFPLSQIHVVLAMEEREESARERADTLIGEFKELFGSIFTTYHPDVPGEVKGKSSNEAYGGREAYRILF